MFILAIVSGSRKDTAFFAGVEFVDVDLGDLVEVVVHFVCKHRDVPQDVAQFFGNCIAHGVCENPSVVSNNLLQLVSDLACLANETESGVGKVESLVRVDSGLQSSGLVVVQIHVDCLTESSVGSGSSA